MNKIIEKIRKLGFWAFMFFFIKGLAWLILPGVIMWFSGGEHVRDHSHLFEIAAMLGACLRSCGGMALCYLGHPNQALLAQPLKRAGWLGLCLIIASLFFWIDSYGALAGTAIAFSLVLIVGVSLPFIATWRVSRKRKKSAN